jgi:hypothetical protein
VTLTPDEISLIRSRNLSRRPEFMQMAGEVCEEMGVTFAQVCGVARGSPRVCAARALICRIAFDRGFHPAVIAQYIRRDRSTVIHAIGVTRQAPKALD